jgi:hypothetical protein
VRESDSELSGKRMRQIELAFARRGSQQLSIERICVLHPFPDNLLLSPFIRYNGFKVFYFAVEFRVNPIGL